MTKPITSVAALMLMEEGKLGLDDPIEQRILPASAATLRKGGYDPKAITIRDLLQHVSGIYDYAMDDNFAATIFTQPTHRWTRAEQLAFAMKHGKPYGKPREVFHYSDTNYILLGEILELTTGKPLGAAVRDLVGFQKLGLNHTWFETLDSVPAGAPPRAHQYQDSLDTYSFDPSFDLYGGGGLVATIDDLAGFYRALVGGKVFANRATLDTMLAPTPQSLAADSTRGYGMGIARRRFGDLVCYGHGGYWGTTASSCPATGLTIAAAIDRSPDRSFDAQAIVGRAVELVRGLPAGGGAGGGR
jgi:D-alanyl-D-alanine carboxypeptidase